MVLEGLGGYKQVAPLDLGLVKALRATGHGRTPRGRNTESKDRAKAKERVLRAVTIGAMGALLSWLILVVRREYGIALRECDGVLSALRGFMVRAS
ncbi:MAG: hypothetical protein JXM70_00515 [Pirellulales bacterium]|nr:hypothetical protein [Pirellulales bacterium]